MRSSSLTAGLTLARPRRASVLQTPILLLALAFSGCVTPAPPPPRDATAALIARPDFKPAFQAAPHWVAAALQQITQYETDLARAERPRP